MGTENTCLFLVIGNENNEKIRTLCICDAPFAQLLAKQVHILLATQTKCTKRVINLISN